MDTDPLFAVFAPPNADRLRHRLGVGADASAELATTGWCKVVVLIDSIAVLVPRHHELVAAVNREVEVLAVLRGVGLPGAPQLFDVVDDPDISPFALAVVERVDGASLESVEPTLSQHRWHELLRSVGSAIALVHDHTAEARLDRAPAEHRAVLHQVVEPDRTRRAEAIRFVADVLDVGTTHGDALADRLAPAAKLAPAIVHNDLHEAQVMVDRNGVTGIIDRQTASVSHPFVDFDVLQWGRGALTRLESGTAAHRRAMWEGARGDRRYGVGMGALLDIAWTANDGWWAATHTTAPVTGFEITPALHDQLTDRARRLLTEGAVPSPDP